MLPILSVSGCGLRGLDGSFTIRPFHMKMRLFTWSEDAEKKTGRKELLAQVHEKMGASHYGQQKRDAAEEKTKRIVEEELRRLGWAEAELRRRPKGDLGKVRIAKRLRAETTVSLKWVAAVLAMGTWTYLANRFTGVDDDDMLNEITDRNLLFEHGGEDGRSEGFEREKAWFEERCGPGFSPAGSFPRPSVENHPLRPRKVGLGTQL